jgi:death-on-curing protein
VHTSAVVFLDVEDVHHCHEAGLNFGGGMAGVRDLGLVQAATMAPQAGYYSTLGEIAAAYVHGIAKNHGYVDGNKRTAANALMMFLGANGFPVVLSLGWILLIEDVGNGSICRHRLRDIIVAQLLGGADVPIDP